MMIRDQKLLWKTERGKGIFNLSGSNTNMTSEGNMEYKSLLRFTTAGSVDDGKSTLIGRLLYDSKSIFEDQLEHVIQSSKRLGKGEMDLSLLTDGLRAEREQGITIDVAYRYFATPVRKFIIADTPGHIQYTRNMVTGASTADLAVILVDARKGVLEQTVRHAYIATLLDIRHIVFCVNKMDMIDYSEEGYLKIKCDLSALVTKLNAEDVYYIPISAKYGDNVVRLSENMKWFKGQTFLRLIETVNVRKDKSLSAARFPVQTVLRPLSSEFHDYRSYAGRVAGGVFRRGDNVVLLPSMLGSRISRIDVMNSQLTEASSGDSVSILIEDQIDINRGDMIVKPDGLPLAGKEITLMLCWFNEKSLRTGGKYILRNNTHETTCIVGSVNYKMNINTLEKDYSDSEVKMNDIANVTIRTSKAIFYDTYKNNNTTGSLILIEEGTNETAGAGMIE
jgi:sulfate adenylyltransferase subunit 1